MCLLENPGELVTREELHRKLWPADTFVNFEQGLNAAVKRLRQALNDSADNPRFVETLPRRGYRFIAPMQTIAVTGDASAVQGAAAVTEVPPTLDLPEAKDLDQVHLSEKTVPVVRERWPRAWKRTVFALLAMLAILTGLDTSPRESPATPHSVSGRAATGKPVRRCIAGLFL